MVAIRDHRQLPLLVPETDWRPTMEMISLAARPEICIDVETRDDGIGAGTGSSWARPGEGFVCGVTVAVEGWERYYPLRHPEGNVDDPPRILAWLRDELKGYAGTVVGMNLPYDLGWLTREGIEVPLADIYDVQSAEAVIDPDREGFNLNAIAHSYGLEPKDERLLMEAAVAYGIKPKDAKANIYRYPGQLVGAYGERDGALPLQIRKLQLPRVAELKLDRVMRVEQQLVRVNMEMRRKGARIDMKHAERTRDKLIKMEQEQLAEIKRLAGVEVNVWETSSVASAFLALDIDFPTTLTLAPSFQAEWLDGHSHPLAHAVRKARKYNKGWSSFIDGQIMDHIDKNGYIHPEWRPLPSDDGGVAAGRYACHKPNLQQVPTRDPEIGPLIRRLYIPEPGEFWFTSDISQQEPRFTVHFAALRGFRGAEEAASKIRDNPKIDYHQMVADFTGLSRKDAKTINLGTAYGMGGAKLCRSLGLPTELWEPEPGVSIPVAGKEGKAILEQYHNRFPFIRPLNDECMQLAQERGWIKTYLGRYARFDLWEPVKRGWHTRTPGLPLFQAQLTYGMDLKRAFTHKALNRLIQGSSADMIKLAMLKMWNELREVPTLTIHDELDTSCGGEKRAREIDQCIRESVELLVPVTTDMEKGPSWGETKKWTS